MNRRPAATITLADLVAARLSRRGFVAGAAMTAASLHLGSRPAAAGASSLGFKELPKGYDENHHVAEGYGARVLIRWGDPVSSGAAAFDPMAQTPTAQDRQFGFNCDFVAFLSLPPGSANSDHGLLVVNHEYSDPVRMFPGVDPAHIGASMTKDHVGIEHAAHGLSIVEVVRQDGTWSVVEDSPFARRISLRSTEILVSGPARGHARLKTSMDPSGERVLGTLNNCSGGVTPWGTVLSGEENFHQYFSGDPAGTPEEANHGRVGIKGKSEYPWWARHDARFDVTKELNEANRFGWIVEVDPYNASAAPVKRTALGRFKHEAATTVINPDGRVVVYSGDDERFDYLYRFVTDGVFDPSNRAANMALFDSGTLSVAKFLADGSLEWLPLVFGTGPLTPANGFESQADVVIETRRAADQLGATPMDRPEDVEVNPATGRVYVMLTNNTKREAGQVEPANPRADNKFGHIIEITAPGGDGAAADHAAPGARWDIFLLGGDPADAAHGAMYGPGVTADGWVAAPDNCAFDPAGRLWIATDGAPRSAGHADAVFACDTTGPARAATRRFFSGPRGAEICGPCFTPDGTTLFLAVQHPAEEDDSTFERPTTRWPDFADTMPPRPSVVAITKDDGGPIGA